MIKSVVFLHIPKCAGTTVCTHMARALGERSFWHGFDGHVSQAIKNHSPGEMLRRYSFIGGHFTREMADALLACSEREVLLAALLRDPMEQVRSYYQWISQVTSHPYHDLCRNRTLAEAVEDERIENELRDIQTRYLFGAGQSQAEVTGLSALLAEQRRVALATTRRIGDLIALMEDFLGCRQSRPEGAGYQPLNVTGAPMTLAPADAVIAASLTARDAGLYRAMESRHSGIVHRVTSGGLRDEPLETL